MTAAEDARWMARALELAALADYRTSPNPMVGSVVVDTEGRLAGEGWHAAAGGPHAEIGALASAGSRARGGTLYATLEPCSHQGRTGPCTEAIIAAGIGRVVAAITDPDPRASGGGLARLEQAGVEVTTPVLEAAAERLNRFYLHHRRTGRPWVTAKFGASLDGRARTREGDSKWITGEAARRHAHRDRHRHDAILIGVATALSDDPELTARLPGARQPLRVVLDSHLRTPPSSRLAGPGTVIATTAAGGHSLAAAGAEVVRLPADPMGRVSLPALLENLGRRGVLSLLVEGGASVLGSFFDQGLVDGVTAYLAPLVIGGSGAGPAVMGLGPALLADATHLENVEIERVADDLVVSATVKARK